MRWLFIILMVGCSYEYHYDVQELPVADGGAEDAFQGVDGARRENRDAGSADASSDFWREDAGAQDASSDWEPTEDAAVGLGQCEVCEVQEDCQEGFECSGEFSFVSFYCLEMVEPFEVCDEDRELKRLHTRMESRSPCVPFAQTCPTWLDKYSL